jgi:hypothetical protein
MADDREHKSKLPAWSVGRSGTRWVCWPLVRPLFSRPDDRSRPKTLNEQGMKDVGRRRRYGQGLYSRGPSAVRLSFSVDPIGLPQLAPIKLRYAVCRSP